MKKIFFLLITLPFSNYFYVNAQAFESENNEELLVVGEADALFDTESSQTGNIEPVIILNDDFLPEEDKLTESLDEFNTEDNIFFDSETDATHELKEINHPALASYPLPAGHQLVSWQITPAGNLILVLNDNNHQQVIKEIDTTTQIATASLIDHESPLLPVDSHQFEDKKQQLSNKNEPVINRRNMVVKTAPEGQYFTLNGFTSSFYDYIDWVGYDENSQRVAFIAENNGKKFVVFNGRQGRTLYDDIKEPTFLKNGSQLGFFAQHEGQWFYAVNNGDEGDVFDETHGLTLSDDKRSLAYFATKDDQPYLVLNSYHHLIEGNDFDLFFLKNHQELIVTSTINDKEHVTIAKKNRYITLYNAVDFMVLNNNFYVLTQTKNKITLFVYQLS